MLGARRIDMKMENQAQKWAGSPAKVIVHSPGADLVRSCPAGHQTAATTTVGDTEPCHPQEWSLVLVDSNSSRSRSDPDGQGPRKENWQLPDAGLLPKQVSMLSLQLIAHGFG